MLATLLVAIAATSLSAAPAYAYNDSGYNYTTGQDSSQTVGNSGFNQRNPVVELHTRSYAGPHGGYTTTTNKCADCHAVHSAQGYLLLRAQDPTDACDFCHQGGGGSSTNIQMDNSYDAQDLIADGTGSGVGHTIGYTGNAPADIKPAFSSAAGLLCFTCHSPHAASTRVLATFADPGRRLGDSRVSTVWNQANQVVTTTPDPAGIDLETFNGGSGTFWGTTVEAGNIARADDGTVRQLPVFPKGRFLLIKNPHPTGLELAEDTEVGSAPGTAGQEGYNKLPIDWDDPLGPYDSTMGGSQSADNDTPYFGGTGLATVSEFCTDCHDGSAGAVSQKALVWRPSEVGTSTGSYVSVYSHDSQPRDMCRAQYLDPAGTASNADGTDDNFGPSCRQCHIGGSSCGQCHGTDDLGVPEAAYTPIPEPANGKTSYWAQATLDKSAVAGLSGRCVDAGFSWPHRTLGVNLLGDELYGVNFDGTPIAAGQRRGDPEALVSGYLDDQPTASEPATDGWKPFSDPEPYLANATAEDMDSVCITCHGAATYWNGDDPAYRHSSGTGEGWELLLKGLP